MVDPVDPIVEALRAERLRQGLTQQQLADLSGLKAQSHISEFETGKETTILSTLRRIADALGFDLVLKERG